LPGGLPRCHGSALTRAAFWFRQSEIALRSRDPHLIGYSLVDQARVRTDLGDGHAVVDLCGAALEDSHRVVPKVRVVALQQQAHGAGLTHDRTDVDRLIDEADRLPSLVDDDLPRGNACRRTPGYLEVQRATRYGRLGLGTEAVRLWDQVLDVVPETARRDRGVSSRRRSARRRRR
jgi:hypothetical protein